MKQTRADAAMESAEEAHSDDPERVEVLRRARRFKASWLELAEALTEVRRQNSWSRWGYKSLDEYAKTELHLRPDTVQKLTGSFSFLKDRAPEILERDGVGTHIPSYSAIDFLRRAEQQEAAPQEAVEEIRRQVLDEGTPITQIRKQFAEVVFPVNDDTKRKRDIATMKSLATRLTEVLQESNLVQPQLALNLNANLSALLSALEAHQSQEKNAGEKAPREQAA